MDIKFIWSGSDAKALVYYITDYVTKMSLSFHDTFALVQKSITSIMNSSHQTDKENAIEKSRKLVLRCYNTLASQQELSGVQVASYLMNWDDHYTTHKFQGLYLIQTERYLQMQLNETRSKQKLEILAHGQHFIILLFDRLVVIIIKSDTKIHRKEEERNLCLKVESLVILFHQKYFGIIIHKK
jgi:hypothetical protein